MHYNGIKIWPSSTNFKHVINFIRDDITQKSYLYNHHWFVVLVPTLLLCWYSGMTRSQHTIGKLCGCSFSWNQRFKLPLIYKHWGDVSPVYSWWSMCDYSMYTCLCWRPLSVVLFYRLLSAAVVLTVLPSTVKSAPYNKWWVVCPFLCWASLVYWEVLAVLNHCKFSNLFIRRNAYTCYEILFVVLKLGQAWPSFLSWS